LRRPVEPIFRRLVSAAADRPGHVLQLRIVPPDLEDLDPMAGGGPGRNRRRPVEASSAFSVQRFGRDQVAQSSLLGGQPHAVPRFDARDLLADQRHRHHDVQHTHGS